MSQFKLHFTLKQHTPMIHFQADQQGATLRASELKPKLDRFLIKYAPELKKYAVKHPNGHLSFNYKVKIIYQDTNEIDYPKAYVNERRGDAGYTAPYFANGKSIEHKSNSPIALQIYSLNSEIIRSIDSTIALFFTLHNFGTRQSKGFGSYHIDQTTTNEFMQLLKKHDHPVFKLHKNFHSAKDTFKLIDTFYKHLKMGQRQPYDKSLLFQYMCRTHHIGWEKKFLKTKFPEIIHGSHQPIVCTTPIDQEYRYIRAVLGLAEHNEYRPKDGKKQIKIESVKRDLTNSQKPPLYQRFKSPITFKIFENQIFVLFDTSYESILNEKFYFKLRGKPETLSTPSVFDMYDFLKFVETKISYFQELK